MIYKTLEDWENAINRLKIACGLKVTDSAFKLSKYVSAEKQPNLVSKWKKECRIDTDFLYLIFDKDKVNYILFGSENVIPGNDNKPPQQQGGYTKEDMDKDLIISELRGEVKALNETVNKLMMLLKQGGDIHTKATGTF